MIAYIHAHIVTHPRTYYIHACQCLHTDIVTVDTIVIIVRGHAPNLP